jgi:YggT family protein
MREVWFIIQTVAAIIALACMLRAWGHKVQLLPRDMIMHFSCTVTDWIVLPIRKFLPLKSRQFDWASVVAALIIGFLAALVFNGLLVVLGGASLNHPLFILWQAAGWVIEKFLYLIVGILLLLSVLSFVNPNAPIAPSLNLLSRPFLAPIRKFISPIGGIDFSPMVLMIAVFVLMSLVNRVFPQI